MTDQNNPVLSADEVADTIRRSSVGMRRYALLPSLVFAGIALIVGIIVSGLAGAIAAVLAAVIIVGGGLLVLWVMRRAAHLPVNLVFGVVMCTYLAKVIVLLVFALVFRHTTLFDTTLFAFTVLAGLVVWTVGEIIGFRRTKTLSVTPAQSQAG